MRSLPLVLEHKFLLKPDWDKEMVLDCPGGPAYNSFYRELRDADGVVRPNVKAQQSVHLVLSNDYSFKCGIGLKLVSEVYY
jgi:hypothetical protein